jgi:hypothetical protein
MRRWKPGLRPLYFWTDRQRALARAKKADAITAGRAADVKWEPWPDNLPLDVQLARLAILLSDNYPESFDRSEGAIEKAARLLAGRAEHDPSR